MGEKLERIRCCEVLIMEVANEILSRIVRSCSKWRELNNLIKLQIGYADAG